MNRRCPKCSQITALKQHIVEYRDERYRLINQINKLQLELDTVTAKAKCKKGCVKDIGLCSSCSLTTKNTKRKCETCKKQKKLKP